MALEIKGEYPSDWKDIALRVKAEAGWRCIRCGHPHGDRREHGLPVLVQCDDYCTHVQDKKMRVLTVHHLDGDKANCRWWNLLALCQVCHLSIQARVNPSQDYLHDHTPWFIPYVCGYYAFAKLGLELTREEVMRRTREILAVGQPWLFEVGGE